MVHMQHVSHIEGDLSLMAILNIFNALSTVYALR